MARSKECPKCGEDISESYQSEDPDVGIGAGWYCDTCDLGVADEDGPEHHDDDVSLFGTGSSSPSPVSRNCACRTPLEMGFGLAGGGGIGSYMYCPSCGAVAMKTKDES